MHRPVAMHPRTRGRRRLVGGLLAAVLVATACGTTATPPPTSGNPSLAPEPSITPSPTAAATPADVIFMGGPILTLTDGLGTVEALAVRGETIAAVGSVADVLAWRGPETELIDLGGRTLMPGFIDSHSHILNAYYGPFVLGRDLSMAERQAVLIENGITSHGWTFVTPELLDEIRDFEATGELKVRVSAYLAYNSPCAQIRDFPDPEIPDPFWWEGVPPTREFGERLRIGGVKVYTDGANCEITPYFSQPLVEGAVPGTPFVTQAELDEIVRRAQAAGHQMAMHAVGDGAVDYALNAVEAALAGGPNDPRHRIEHSSILRLWDAAGGPRQLERYGELGIVATIFADWPSCESFAPRVNAEFAPWEWAYRELVDANPGLDVAWSGDAPAFDTDPIHNLFGFVTRDDLLPNGTICKAPPEKAGGTFSVDEALRMMTLGSAYSLFRETEVGSLVPGKLADLIILSADPHAVAPEAIGEITLRMTMIGGEALFCADPAEGVCPASAPDPEPSPTPAALPSGWSVSASASIPGSPPEQAFDGDLGTLWSAGAHPTQWIEVDFGRPVDIGSLELVVSQYPAGTTEHRLIGRLEDGTEEPLGAFLEPTEDGQILSLLPFQPYRDIRSLRIETVAGPSWVAWREIRLEVGG